MKVFSLIILFISFNAIACNLDKKFDYISLSGPVTFLLQELKLLNDKSLKGISVFSPVDKKDFRNKIYGGGLFLSEKEKKDFDKKIVFFDQGLELKKYLKSSNSFKNIAIETRDLGALKATSYLLDTLSPYLENCSLKVKKVNKRLNAVKEKISQYKKVKNKTFIFYLGEVKNKRFPNLVMANDGIVKTLKDSRIIQTYPSDLSYVSWSQKVVSSLKNTVHIGVSENKEFQRINLSDDIINIKSPGALTPGLSQVYLIDKLLGISFF